MLLVVIAACTPSAPAANERAEDETSINAADDTSAAEPSASRGDRPTFALDHFDGIDAVEHSGSIFSDGTFSGHEDSLTGGQYMSSFTRAGSGDVLTMPNDRVWRIQLRSGMGDRCGSPVALERAAPKIIAALDPAAKLRPEDTAAISKGVRRGTGDDIAVGRVLVSPSGGCIASLYFTAR